MSARGSWTRRRAQRPEHEESFSGLPALTGPMNATHRCDRCGSQAYVRVRLRSRLDLLFCAHHYRQHAVALAAVAVGIQNETSRLTLADRPR
jgi:hypothetical protein